jgi:2-polyprenyl-3-methyl-5-hydroxy-6-metoxy-1,4-benzoquinol methylase
VNPEAELLDVGCSDGLKTLTYALSISTDFITGVDVQIAPDLLLKNFVVANIDKDGLPFNDNIFDVVTSQHVIEHVSDTDKFVAEICRVLVPGGYALIATPNLASGRVIAELLMDKQPGITHVSDNFIQRGDPGHEWEKSAGYLHRRLFTMEGLRSLLLYNGLTPEVEKRTGYGPFIIGEVLQGLYATNLIVKARKC